jgi:hypothetical protein
MYYYITIEPTEFGEEVKTFKTDKLDCEYSQLREHCGPLGIDTFQILCVRIGNTNVQMYLDDDGKCKDRQPNDIATILSGIYPYDYIVGPVIILADDRTEYTHYLTAEQVDDVYYHIKTIEIV